MAKPKNLTPPLNALKVFDAVARLGSMNRAAAELGVAPSSVTQHIRNLEDFVGTDLFDRTANAISLNARGRAYAEDIRAGFDIIQNATGTVVAERARDPLRISCAPTFASAWLAEQLAVLEAEYPGLEVRCDFSPIPVDFESDTVDLALRYGPGQYPGTTSDLLYVDRLAPVCSAETAARISDVQALREVTRLDSAESAPDGRSLWAYWAASALGEPAAGQFERPAAWALQSSLFSIEVLRTSPAVAILEHAIVRDLIEDGRLVAPVGLWVPAPYGYHILSSKRRPLSPHAKRLKTLLKRSVKARFEEAD